MDPIVETLNNWDVSITDSLLEKMEAEKERREQENIKRKSAVTNKLVFNATTLLETIAQVCPEQLNI